MFPAALYPASVYPAPLYPGAKGSLAPVAPIVVLDNELANWLTTTLGVDCFPLSIPEGTTDYPVLVYTRVDGGNDDLMAGPDGLAEASYQVDAYSPSYADAATLAERLRLALLGLVRRIRPPAESAAMGAASVRNAHWTRPLSGFDPSGIGEDNRGMYRYMGEFTLDYEPSPFP